MIRKSVSVCLLIGLVTASYSAIPKMRATDRLAISHDGNNWDKDDTYAYAMDYAVIWAHGMQNQLVHQQINNLLSKDTKQEFYKEMLESGKGRFLFPGFDTTIQKDCHLDDGRAAVAHFAKVAGESSDQSLLFFLVCGPMEVPWQSINATAKDKRKYIRVLSHSDWNEDHTGGQGLLTHTFKNMMTSFAADGVQFYSGAKKGYTAPNVIQDQNNNFGGGGTGSGKWAFLTSMTGSTIPQSTWTWLKGRDFKLNGDNSDHGLVWVALTGNDNAKPSPEAETRFKSPLPMVPKFPGSTSISPESNTHPSINKSFNVIAQSNSQSLSVTVRELKGSGTITIYDLFSRVVAEGKIENGIAQLPVSSKLSGNHIVNISSNEVKISKVVTLINP